MDALLTDFLILPQEQQPTPTQDSHFDFPPPAASSSSSWPHPAGDSSVLFGDSHWGVQDPQTTTHDVYGTEFDAADNLDGSAWQGGLSLDGGIELGEIAPLPGFPPSSFLPAFFSNPTPPAASSSTTTAFPNQQILAGPPSSSGYDTPSPASSSHLSSLPPPTPPSCRPTTHLSGPGSLKRAREETAYTDEEGSVAGSSSINPYALSLTSGSPEPDFHSSTPSSSSLSADVAKPKKELTGKGKKRKQLPTVAEFQQPNVDGLSKKEARLVKNRAAAFLSRQRKREQFDEMEGVVDKLKEEIAALKAAAAAGGGSATPTPQVAEASPSALSALHADLANLRALLHASTSRERSLEVEVASLRAQLARAAASAQAGAGGEGSRGGSGQGPMVSGFEVVGAGRGRGERRKEGERDGKRIGGVALMVIMFSFALFSFPSTLSSLPIRLPNASSTNTFPNFLGRVLQASSSANLPSRFANVTIAKDGDAGVCTLKDKAKLPAPGGNSTVEEDEPMECDAADASSSSSTEDAPATNKDLSWPLLPAVEGQSDVTRRSLSLTFLRPVPSPSDGTSVPDEGVDEVLSRWLGLHLDDASTSTTADGSLPALDGAFVPPAAPVSEQDGGWLLIGPGEGTYATSGEATREEGAVKAWDGTTLERMELDDVLAPSPLSGSVGLPSTPTLYDQLDSDVGTTFDTGSPTSDEDDGAESDETASDRTYRRASPASFPHLYSLSPSLKPTPSSTSNDTFADADVDGPRAYVRLDVELDLALRTRHVGLVDRAEVGRLLEGRTLASGSAAGLGSWSKGLGLEGLM